MCRTRILFLIPTLTAGGAERVITTLLRHLDKRRFDITLAVVNMRDGVFRAELPTDIQLIDLNCGRVRYAIPKIVALAWRIKPSVVFSTLGHLNIVLAIVRHMLPVGMRLIARETSIVSNTIQETSYPRYWAWLYKTFYPYFDQIICQSHYMAEDLQRNFGIKSSSLVIINNPVDIQRISQMLRKPLLEHEDFYFARSNGTLLLLAAGRLVDVKGFDILIQAIALCRDLSVRVLILGEGPERSRLESMCVTFEVEDRVRFAGYQSNPYPFIAKADAFILSSRYEGFPNVVLEALACGTPVIATPAPGGTLEILAGIDGCEIAESVSVDALAIAIRRVCLGRRERIGVEAVSRFAVVPIISAYTQVFSDGGRH